MSDNHLIAPLLDTAINSALAAGKFILSHLNRMVAVKFKGRANLVTEVDRGAEQLIVSAIQDRFPDHQILAEETPAKTSASDYRWIIDPLDGTTNFFHGFPVFAVSIGIEYQGQPLIGVVYDPTRDELFSAVAGQGARLNNQPVQVSKTSTLARSLLATGFPYEIGRHFDLNMAIFNTFYRQCQGVRRAGAAAIDLCYTACGRFDAYWEFDLHPWDAAAGALIVTEAGGRLSDFHGRPFSIYRRQILASNGFIHQECLTTLAEFFKREFPQEESKIP